jgi:hypothetical protein
MLDEFYGVAFRKKVYRTIEQIQEDVDTWVREYNEVRPHAGRWCYGKTPMQTFLDMLPIAKEKMLDSQREQTVATSPNTARGLPTSVGSSVS